MKGFIGSLLLGSCICSCTTKLHAQSAEFAPIGATWWYDQVEMFPPYNIALNKFDSIHYIKLIYSIQFNSNFLFMID